MKFVQLIIVVVLWQAIAGCRPETLSPERAAAYAMDESNGLRKSRKVGDLQMDVVFRPNDLLVFQEVRSRSYDSTELASLQKKYSPNLYFILALSDKSREALTPSDSRYLELVETLSFRMSEYVTLTTSSGDTLALKDFVMNRTLGMSSSTDVIFVFDRKNTLTDDWVAVNLKEFGLGTGDQTFKFLTRDLLAIPSIEFSKI
jgi:hypothetical protein